MKNLILILCLSFYCIHLSAKSDSLVTVLEKTLQTQVDSLGEEHLDIAMYCDSLGEMYMKAGKYPQADSLFTKAFDIKIKQLEEKDPDIADSYHYLGEVYRKTGNYEKADSFHNKALNIRLEIFGEKHIDIAKSYNNLGLVYYRTGDYEKAIRFHNKALNITLKVFGEDHSDLAKSYNNLGIVYYRTGDYEKAIRFHHKALNIRLKVFGEDHSDLAKSYNNLGIVYYRTGDYEKADTFFNEALNIKLAVFGEKHHKLAVYYNNLGNVYYRTGNYEKAIRFHNKALNIRLEAFGKKHPLIADSYNNLGNIHNKMGDYEKAIRFHNKALNIRLKAFGGKNLKTAMSYNNLGIVYYRTGNYEKAIRFHHKALNIRLEILGEKHSDIAKSYNNLGIVYYTTGDYEKAAHFYNKALNIKLQIFDEKHLNLVTSYNNMGIVYYKTGDYEKAIDFHNKALNISRKVFGDKHSKIATSYSNLGNVYRKTGDYEKSVTIHNKALNIRLETFGEKHSAVAASYKNIADTYQALNNYKTADSIWHIVINQSLERLNDTYLFLPDNQRLEYAKTFKEVYNGFYSFAAKHGDDNTKKLAAYLSLNTKSLALNYSVSVRKLINSIDNEALKTLHNKLNILNENISQAELSDEELGKKNWELDSLRNQQETLTRQLLQNKALREKLYKTPVTWEDTQSQLKPDEAAIDFVRFYEENDSTWMYYAILTRKDIPAPEFVRITDQEAISTLLQDDNQDGQPDYIQSENKEDLRMLYQKIWQPLTPYLSDVKTVHLSPSGLLHRVDFDVLQNENGAYLADHFEFHYYTTIRDFAKKKTSNWLSKIFDWLNNIFNPEKYEDLLLFGDIAYNSPPVQQKPDTIQVIAQVRSGFDPIPNTGKEIRGIGKINEEEGGKSVYITGNDAKEDTLKYHTENHSPDIIHFATHGAYLARIDNTATAMQYRLYRTGNPLQRSIIAFSGANDTWTSEEYIFRSSNDGILTAYEVSHLDLSKTKLVVLSACETALGDIHDTEGVLGLQSAFKLAGVEHVVVSLWKVNDRTTKELMVAFYKNLLDKKQDAPTALRKAKTEMRQSTDNLNWAGFILIE